MIKLALFGLLCAGAIVVARCARQERDCLVFAATVLAVNWLLFSMPWIYAPWSPAFLAYDYLHLPARQEDAWAIVDLASLAAVGWRCRHVWWAPMLWTPYIVTLAMLAVAYCNDLQYIDYVQVLDAALVLQLAVIFMLGGGGCADRLSGLWRDVRGVGGTSSGCSSQAKAAR